MIKGKENNFRTSLYTLYFKATWIVKYKDSSKKITPFLFSNTINSIMCFRIEFCLTNFTLNYFFKYLKTLYFIFGTDLVWETKNEFLHEIPAFILRYVTKTKNRVPVKDTTYSAETHPIFSPISSKFTVFYLFSSIF